MKWRHKRHSLSGKLMILFLFSAIAFVILVGGSIRYAMEGNFRERALPHLAQYLEYIQNDIGDPADYTKAKQLADELQVDLYIIQGETHWSSSQEALPLEQLNQKKSFQLDGATYSLQNYQRQHFIMSERDGKQFLISLPRTNAYQEHGWGHLLLPIFILLLLIMLLYHATRRLVSPIMTIQHGVKTFAEGKLEHRIQVSRNDELGHLANSANEMADEIQRMLDAKRQLLLAISHELRSPLTRAKVAIEMLEETVKREAIATDLNEIEQLIEEILETERLSMPHKVLNKKTDSLPSLVEELLQESFADIAINWEGPAADLQFAFDGPRIKLLLKNLLENALNHTHADSPPPSLLLEHGNGVAQIIIRDHGPGIDGEHLPHLTEPFYRVDPARQRETGGYGLGLYLCKMIAEAHQGELQIDSVQGEGTTITVTLPTNL